jgi:glycine hydroxymethyltransferase
MILCKEEFAKEIDKMVFPGIQGGPLMHVIAAKAVCFGEALRPEFKQYQRQIRENADALAAALIQEGFRIVSGGTDSHLMLVDLRPFGVTGKLAQNVLDSVHITTNKNAIPFDPEKPFVASGIRLGTPAVTSRGMGPEEMKQIASLIARTLKNTDNDSEKDRVKAEVIDLCARFPLLP